MALNNQSFVLSKISQYLQGRPLTASTAAWLICYIAAEEWMLESEFEMLLNGVDQACDVPLPSAAEIKEGSKRGNYRYTMASSADISDIKIFCDYKIAVEALQERYKLVETVEEADFLFTVAHINNFFDLPPNLKVNQIPYEGGFVRKVMFTSALVHSACENRSPRIRSQRHTHKHHTFFIFSSH